VWLSGNCGHNWVKARFRIRTRQHPDIIGDRIDFETSGESADKIIDVDRPQRVVIHGFLCENRVLLHADPGYEDKIRAAARNPAELSAWLDGSWDIVAGGMFDDVWNSGRHIVPQFQVPPSWTIERAYDWGSSKPFSVGWWARSDGTSYLSKGQRVNTVPGDLFRVGEWYGWTGQPNEGLRLTDHEIAKGILERERMYWPNRQIAAGPADAQIWDKVNNVSTAEIMESHGCFFTRFEKVSGTRVQGWQRMRTMMKSALQPKREEPGLFVTENCHQFIRTIPVLPRSGSNPDDVDTDSEDHIGDESRYAVLARSQSLGIISIAGR